MITIHFHRYLLSVMAITVKNNQDVFVAAGFTKAHATRKLYKSMEDYYYAK